MRWQNCCDKSLSLRTFFRFLPIFAIVLTAVAAYFGIKNYQTLEASRATTILRRLEPMLTQAHQAILDSLASIQSKLSKMTPPAPAPMDGNSPL